MPSSFISNTFLADIYKLNVWHVRSSEEGEKKGEPGEKLWVFELHMLYWLKSAFWYFLMVIIENQDYFIEFGYCRDEFFHTLWGKSVV